MVDCVLLVTGTIRPNTNISVEINNKDERLREYINCLKYYICKSEIAKIVFCENSRYTFNQNSLFKLAQKYNKQLEILQFEGDVEKIGIYGKGYGEGEIIEYAFNNSKLIKNSDYFIKVTGRLIVNNLKQIIDKMVYPKTYFNLDLYGYQCIDTRLYGMTTEQYRNTFIHLYYNVRDRRNRRIIEKIFINTIRKNNIHIYNFPVYPEIIGCSGSSAIDYAKDIRYIKWVLKIESRLNIINSKYIYYANYILLNVIMHHRKHLYDVKCISNSSGMNVI